jgi:hypothetical protein
MSLPQKRLSPKKRSPALVLDEHEHTLNSPERAGRINSTQFKLDETGTGKRAFFEDFTLEHSLSGLQISSIDIAGCF